MASQLTLPGMKPGVRVRGRQALRGAARFLKRNTGKAGIIGGAGLGAASVVGYALHRARQSRKNQAVTPSI